LEVAHKGGILTNIFTADFREIGADRIAMQFKPRRPEFSDSAVVGILLLSICFDPCSSAIRFWFFALTRDPSKQGKM
jgi:hypothetical protein